MSELIRQLTGEAPNPAFPRGAVDTQMHLYLPGYPALPGGPGLPPGSLPGPADYRKLMQWLGIDRVIITQGNAHQRDNANTLACVAEIGEAARAVVIIDAKTTEKDMESLTAAGTVGARIMDLPGGAVNLSELEAVDERAHAADWMVAVQFDGNTLLDHLPRLEKIRSRWVFDHHGKFFKGIKTDGPEMTALLKLIDRGNVWFKFAGVYESSRDSWPYEDVAAFSRVIAAHAPERIVWGTNWPHNSVRETAAYPDDARLAELVLGWLPDDTARQRALVDNPEALFKLPSSAAA
ncbi:MULTISPECIES: amidohydrolase family protein [Rhizobium/Agrobacterium group]|uniref:amidohydrolase family protein n=1 Tax=Rhizobium/Agrobacterium group TaxID=227290 RepID=UPI00230067DA|nr:MULTISPECIES: amidohydrolase family protein [Rhizobium/Agrobacterium group]MDA5635465.1 amidohydrolase family protein [Agrobacterium sp. ST15.16.024]MDF1890713.1 amidohydrolase family protein [Rhizobium rhizogenes]